MNSLTRSVIISTLFVCAINCSKQRNILFKEFNDKLQKLENIEEWKTRLRTEFGESLQKLPENIKEMIIERANKELNSTWQQLLATDYLSYKMTGRRDLYEKKLFDRLTRLQVFVLAQALKPREEFLLEVANGLWLVLEQSTWVWPAHMSLQIGGDGLPNPDQFIIDLGVGETSAFVTWIGFLLGKNLFLTKSSSY